MTKQHDALLKQLQQGIDALSLSVSLAQQEKLLGFLYLLEKWNKAYNLTAIKQLDDMVSKHLLDSLSIYPFIDGEMILDVGTGPGLPGIPLAICFPEKNFHLLDSNGKRVRFMTHVAGELQIQNIQPTHSRVEDWKQDHAYDRVLVRAFSELDRIWALCHGLLKPQGQILAMKGNLPTEEISKLPKHTICRSTKLNVPMLDSQRHMVCLQLQDPLSCQQDS